MTKFTEVRALAQVGFDKNTSKYIRLALCAFAILSLVNFSASLAQSTIAEDLKSTNTDSPNSANSTNAENLSPKVFAIAQKLRCPTCRSESVSESSSLISLEMRDIINDQLAAGKNEQEILNYFQARYGDWILLEPPRQGRYLVVWILPILALIGGFGLLIFYLLRWQQQGNTPLESIPTEDMARVKDFLNQNQTTPTKES